MPEKTQLLLYNPCHEQWGDMLPNDEGRFCGACQKTVVDFTMMSDRELLDWFAGRKDSVCGRMSEDQLGRDLEPGRGAGKSRWAIWWQLLLAGMLVSSEASAQVKPRNQVIQIIDSATQRPVPGASVQMDNDPRLLVADSAGRVIIPRHRIEHASTLDISSIGYGHAVIAVGGDWLGEEKVVKLATRAMDLPVVSIVTHPNYDHHAIFVGGAASVRRVRHSLFGTIKNVLKDTVFCRKSPLTVYPNPVVRGASITLSLRIDQPGDYMAQLYTAGGAVVESIRMEGVDKTRTELMEVPGTLAAGIYFVRVFHLKAGKLYTVKVVVL